MVVLVTKFDVDHYRHVDVLLRFNHIYDPKIALHNISDVHVLAHVQSLRAYEFGHARKTFFPTSTAAACRFDECEGAPLVTLNVRAETEFVVLIAGMYRIQTKLDLQKAKKCLG